MFRHVAKLRKLVAYSQACLYQPQRTHIDKTSKYSTAHDKCRTMRDWSCFSTTLIITNSDSFVSRSPRQWAGHHSHNMILSSIKRMAVFNTMSF
jgi:hypothetical protein